MSTLRYKKRFHVPRRDQDFISSNPAAIYAQQRRAMRIALGGGSSPSYETAVTLPADFKDEIIESQRDSEGVLVVGAMFQFMIRELNELGELVAEKHITRPVIVTPVSSLDEVETAISHYIDTYKIGTLENALQLQNYKNSRVLSVFAIDLQIEEVMKE